MDDSSIIGLYQARCESAIAETAVKYERYCRSIAFNILANEEDTEECVNDAFLAAWNSIPPYCPNNLKTYLGKLTRNIFIDRWRSNHRHKNGGGEIVLALDELGECVAGLQNTEQAVEDSELFDTYIRFLESLSPDTRRIFLRRYFYTDSITDIARRYGYTEGKVKSILHRTRNKLKTYLKKEGF